MRPSKSGCPWGEAFFRRRLRDAIRDEKLHVIYVNLIQSATKGHFHAIVTLRANLPIMQRLIWQLHLGSDLYRGRADLMRAARNIYAPSLLIVPSPIPSFRTWDFKCGCTEKHVTEKIFDQPEGERCKVWNKLRGMSPWELFGRSPRKIEKSVSLPVGIVPLELIMKEEEE